MKTLLKLLIITLTTTTLFCNANNLEATNKTLNSWEEKPNQKIKVALLLDTSNSMDGLINQAKTQLWEIVNELSYSRYGSESPDLLIALYEYGNDGLEVSTGYIRQVLNFSEDLDEISEKLFGLKTNGGSEYCGQVIQTSLNDLEWGTNKNDLKLIFIAGNEPFTQGHINYKNAATNAKEKDITINTIFCGNYENGIFGKWQDGAQLTNGEYLTINHNQKIIHIATPYDKIIIELNTKLNGTYINYGHQGIQKLKLQAVQDTNAEELNEVVIVKRAVSKSSRLYKNSSWDLVDADKENNFNYQKLDKKSLPTHLQHKTTEELKKYVHTKRTERKEIQFKIQELNKLRNKYVTQKRKEATTSSSNLESALISAIKKQALKKNFSWKKN